MVLESAQSRRLEQRGRSWRIWVDAPPDRSLASPIIWVLDGAALFPLVSDTMRRLAARAPVTGVPPAVVIGVARAPPDRTRRPELMPWPSDDPAQASVAHGAAEDLLDLIMGPALDLAAGIAPADRARQVLIGHSMMAYFVLWALSERPGAFQAFAAVSPSIWWNQARLFSALKGVEDTGQRVFIAAGSREEPSVRRAAGDDRRQKRRMVSRAAEAAGLLNVALGDRAIFHTADDEDHASLLPAVLPRLLRFAFAGFGDARDG